MPAFQFNSQGIDPGYSGGGSYLPPGKHPVVIVGSELKPTKNNDGGYLALTLEAIDGPAKGVQMVERLNLHNKNADAVRIANQQLSAICHVVGVFAFQNTEELHGKPFVVETKVRADNANQTEVAKVYDINGNAPGQAGGGASQQQGGGSTWGGGNAGGGTATGQEQQGGGNATGGGWGGNGGGNAGGGASAAGGGGAWSQGGGNGGGGQPGWGAR